jgi:uncharacterized DUF497 family protein
VRPTLRFEWDEVKNAVNLKKHGVALSTATVVFDDPHQLLIRDRVIDGEQRWQTIGSAGGVVLLLVVHTMAGQNEDEVFRLISARKAEKHERRWYEDGFVHA